MSLHKFLCRDKDIIATGFSLSQQRKFYHVRKVRMLFVVTLVKYVTTQIMFPSTLTI